MKQLFRRSAVAVALLTILSSNLYAAPVREGGDTFFKRLLHKLSRVVSVLNDGTISVPPGKP